MRYFLLIIVFLSGLSLKSQGHKEVKWSFSISKTGKDYTIAMVADVDNGWHIYSQNMKGDGPVPTSFKYELPKGIKLVGKTSEPNPQKVYDENFGMEVKYFNGKVEFKQKISGSLKKGTKIKGTVNYMICNDNMCLPPVDVTFDVEL